MVALARLLTLLCLPLMAGSQETSAITYFDVRTPRPFGYVIGDVIRHEVRIAVENPYRLEKGTLPAQGPLNYWLDLRDVNLREEAHDGETRYEIALTYQTYYAPLEATLRSIPGYNLQFRGGGDSFDVYIDGWDFTMSPLRELMARTIDGRQYMRPDTPPPMIDTSGYGLRITVPGVLALMALIYLLYYYAVWPFHARPARPFAHARRKLHAMRRRPHDVATYRQAIQYLHGAFNEAYGRPLFVESIHRFVAQNPAFKPLLPDIRTFFAYSQEAFFATRADAAMARYPVNKIESLCHSLQITERRAV